MKILDIHINNGHSNKRNNKHTQTEQQGIQRQENLTILTGQGGLVRTTQNSHQYTLNTNQDRRCYRHQDTYHLHHHHQNTTTIGKRNDGTHRLTTCGTTATTPITLVTQTIRTNHPRTTKLHRRLHGKSRLQKRRYNNNRKKVKNTVKEDIVTNYSNYKLSSEELTLLNKGLGFIPTSKGPNVYKHNTEMERFERNLQNHYFFTRKGQQTNTYRKELFTGKSQWQPPNPDVNISRCVGDLNIELLDTRKHKLRYNLDIKTRTAMKKLKENKNIIIKKADKGGGIVIMNTSDYVEKIHTMLADPETYEKVDNDKTQQIWTACNQLISSTLYDNYKINNKQLKYLTQFIARCPVFYGLPKIHKTNWPLRPIVSQIQGPLSKLNEVVDTLLKPCTSCIGELLQDTTQFLQLIEQNQKLPEKHPELRLVTVDVTALYTNIPHEEGAKWVAEYYLETLPEWKKKHPEIKPISGENLETMIRFILENNVFEFLGKFYKQKIGTTMGAQFSVNYANIYMHKFFRIFNRTYNYDLPTSIRKIRR